MNWHEKIGLGFNPFIIRPNSFIVGRDKLVSTLITKVQEGNICLITGTYGTGKTSILKLLIQIYRGQRRVIYYSCNRHDGFIDFDKLLKGRTFVNKLFNKKSKNMILLLDEVNELNLKEREQLVDYLKKNYFKSVVLVAKAKSDMNLNSFLSKGAKESTFQLDKLSEKDAVKIVRGRLGKNKLLSDKIIKLVWNKSKNPRTFLQDCEDVCKYAINEGRTQVKQSDLLIL